MSLFVSIRRSLTPRQGFLCPEIGYPVPHRNNYNLNTPRKLDELNKELLRFCRD